MTSNAVALPLPPTLEDAAAAAVRAMAAPDGSPYAPGHRLGVSFSGGVDSVLVAALAVRAFGPEATVALIAVSPSLARRELASARRTAVEIGIPLEEVPTHETDVDAYRANSVDRCYHCRTEMFTRFTGEAARRLGLAAIAYGENSSDAERIDRPGARAATEFGVLRPLAVAGIDKATVRDLARSYGLSVADKPASPCLASRVPHGVAVTPELLRQIDDAEEAVFEAGFPEARVRHHGDIARIEVRAEDIARFADPAVREAVVRGVRAAGYSHVTVDLAGLQSGAFTLSIIQRPHE